MPRRENYNLRRPRRNQPEPEPPADVPIPEPDVPAPAAVPVPQQNDNARRGRANRRRGHAEIQQPAQPPVDQNLQPPAKQMRTTAVQSEIGNVILDTNEPMIMPSANETDIFVSQNIKQKIWNFEYIDFSILLIQNSQYYDNTEQKQKITVENGMLVVSSKPERARSIDNIEIWTEAFSNFSKLILQRHPSLAQDLFTYMSVIRGAVSDAPFERVYQYDRQFRLRVAQNHTKSWAQIDVFLWLQYIAKGAQGIANNMVYNIGKPCYDYNFKGFCRKYQCLFTHSCMKCSLQHPAISCVKFERVHGYQGNLQRAVNNNFGMRHFLPQPNRPTVQYRAPTFRQNRPLLPQNRPFYRARYSSPRFN